MRIPRKKKQEPKKKTQMELTEEEKQILLRMRNKKQQKGEVANLPPGQEQQKRKVIGCKMVLCEDPITGEMKLFPIQCPIKYMEASRAKMREKGVTFATGPLGDDIELELPEE